MEDVNEFVPLESCVGRMAREYNDPERHMREVDETIRMLESVYLSSPPSSQTELLEPPFEIHLDDQN